MYHLKIMESLGGDRLWFDRFCAQHAAFFYYWVSSRSLSPPPPPLSLSPTLNHTHTTAVLSVFLPFPNPLTTCT